MMNRKKYLVYTLFISMMTGLASCSSSGTIPYNKEPDACLKERQRKTQVYKTTTTRKAKYQPVGGDYKVRY